MLKLHSIHTQQDKDLYGQELSLWVFKGREMFLEVFKGNTLLTFCYCGVKYSYISRGGYICIGFHPGHHYEKSQDIKMCIMISTISTISTKNWIHTKKQHWVKFEKIKTNKRREWEECESEIERAGEKQRDGLDPALFMFHSPDIYSQIKTLCQLDMRIMPSFYRYDIYISYLLPIVPCVIFSIA